MMNKPIKPEMPLNMVQSSRGWDNCMKCHSSLLFRVYFGLPACLQEKCEDYYGGKRMRFRRFLLECFKLCKRILRGNPYPLVGLIQTEHRKRKERGFI